MSFIYPANCRFEDVISDVTNHFKITDPKIQFLDERGDMITIDSSQVFDKALEFAWENSMKGKLDMIRLDLQIESKSIIPVRCRSCRNEFLITSEYVHSDICQQWYNNSSNLSYQPLERTMTDRGHQTPNYRTRTSDRPSYSKTQSTKFSTPKAYTIRR